MNTNDVNVNDRVEGNWGAMFPIDEGTITYVSDDGFATVVWDEDGNDLPDQLVKVEDFQIDASPNGSPIGIFLKKYLD